jgi:hypothetical protein
MASGVNNELNLAFLDKGLAARLYLPLIPLRDQL